MGEPVRLYRVLSLQGPPESLDIAAAVLHEQGCLGIEEHSDGLRAYFEHSVELDGLAAALSRQWPEVSFVVEPPLPDRDWWQEWKQSLQGFAVGTRYFILPTWCAPVDTTRRVLRIDPERAFGTGTHETTALEVGLIEARVEPGNTVLDIGTGTGILAMVAASEGASRVRAIEPDPDACECARRNIARNGFGDIVKVEEAGWEDFAELRADIVVANINASVLQHAVPRLRGTLLLSGILTEELAGFIDTLPSDAEVVTTRTSGEWSALVIAHQ